MSKTNAKSIASEKALEKLKQLCWTIQTKKYEDTDEAGLSKDILMGNSTTKQNQAIPDSNIGNKLLKKMGWVSGGIGKKGREGIAEPVTATGVINREGLGLQAEKGIDSNFMPQIKSIVQNYIRSDNVDDLAFASDFSKEERAMIHKECQKLGLKTHSHGIGEERYLVVSRKRNPSQLFNHIMSQGGETSKYKLMPPGQENPSSQ